MALQIGIMDALPEKERSQGISFYSLFTYIPGVIGPVLALGLWQTGGMDSFTLIFVAIAICTGLFGYSVKMDEKRLHRNKRQAVRACSSPSGKSLRIGSCSDAVS